jgi:hypothetical protein
LAFRKLKAKAIEHELMFIRENKIIAGFLRSELFELLQAI